LNSRQTFTGSFYQTGSVASFSSCVGIGITTPTYYLDVQIPSVTQARFRGCSTDASIIRIENSSNSACFSVGVAGNNNVGSAPNNSLYLRDETNNIVKISMTSGSTGTILLNQCGGNVGIGVTSTNSLLSLCGTFSDTTPLINITGTGTGAYQKVISVVNPGMAVGNDLMIQMGSALSCRNAGQIYFHTDGTGCPTNRVSIGLYQIDNILNVTGNGFVGIGTTTTCGLLSINAPVTSVPSIRFQNSITAGLDSAISNYVSAVQTLLVLGTNSYITSVGTICRFNTSYESSYISFDEGTVRIGTGPTSSNSSAKFTIGPTGVATFSCQIQTNGACVIVNRGDGNPAVLQLANAQNSYQIQFTCTGGQRLAFLNGAPSEFASFYGTGVSVFTGQTCINGSGAGLQFTGGNNRIYFGACRAIEGSTSGTSLQLGENYTKLSLQAHGQFSCGVGGGSPKLFFGEEGPETAGAKAIYLESYWMILQPHYNEGFRIRAVNASGTQRTLAEFYGSGEVYFANMAAGAGTYNVKWTSGGRITYDNSSCRYKNNIRNSVYGLCDILKLNSRMFEYKDGGRTDVGLIAEEVNQVIPELAIKNPEGQPDAVSYDRMVSVLIKGMQEQQCTINTLKTCLGIA
jgi:hypothetical protein